MIVGPHVHAHMLEIQRVAIVVSPREDDLDVQFEVVAILRGRNIGSLPRAAE